MKNWERCTWILLVLAMALAAPAAAADSEDGAVFKHGVMISQPKGNQGPSAQVLPQQRAASAINVAVVDSQGTDSLSQTIWIELNTNWPSYGPTQVIIDYTSLNKEGISHADLVATGADVLIISCAGPYVHQYTMSEVNAITQYVQEGHGIVITYYSLDGNNAQLAPLVGIDTNNNLLTNYFPGGIHYDLLDPGHPVFTNVPDPYNSGVPYMVTPGLHPIPWPLTTGVKIASAIENTGGYIKEGAIVENEVSTHRGVYFAHYIEDQSAGSNTDDKQTFYNSLLWVADMGEPLSTDVDTISAATGGTVIFTLDAGAANASRNYFLLGSVTGTSGIALPGGLATLPLSWDVFTNLVITLVNTSVFTDFLGTLDAQGIATASLNATGPLPPGSVGLVMYYAYALDKPFDFASNFVTVTVVN